MPDKLILHGKENTASRSLDEEISDLSIFSTPLFPRFCKKNNASFYDRFVSLYCIFLSRHCLTFKNEEVMNATGRGTLSHRFQ